MYYVNENIKDLYRVGCNESRKDFLRLDMNENPEGLPENLFKEVMSEITPEYVAMYPETFDLIKLLSNMLKCEKENICLTNGSDDAIRLAFEVFGQLDKKIISVNPSFEMYSVYSKMYGMHHVPIHFNEKFEVDIEEIIDSIDKNTGIVSLLNPNSPIGKSWNKNQIIRIIEKAKENQAVVIIDEAYYYFNPISFLDLIYEYDNLMIFRTFSKLLSIAGGRIGYIVSNYKMIDMLKRASGTYPVNCFAIKFAEKLLENPSIIENLIKIEKEGREFLISKLKTNNYDYYCNGGNYILIRSNKMPKELFDMLKERKILIKTYNNPVLVDWIRITTGGIESMKLFWNEFEKLDLL